jgi:DNA-binding transcriptional ArsR family regulator
MQDVFYIEGVEQAVELLKPIRIELLKQMAEPRTCPELAEQFQDSPQKIYYHVKALEKAGLVEKVEERRVRGVVEGYYQAKARSYWLAPNLVGQIGGEQATQDQTSLRYLLTLAEEFHADIGHLGHRSEAGVNVPSLGLSAQVYLPDGQRRAEFLEDVQNLFQSLAQKYDTPADERTPASGGGSFRLILACYPKTQRAK